MVRGRSRGGVVLTAALSSSVVGDGALVLVDGQGAAFVLHLEADDPEVAQGQELTVRAAASIDPWAWYVGPGFPDSHDFAQSWREGQERVQSTSR